MKQLITIMASALVLLCELAAGQCLEGQVVIESKEVLPNQQGITLDFTIYTDLPMVGMTVPVVVREIDPGSFWTGTLPYDTGGNAFFPGYSEGVEWSFAGMWAALIQEMRPGVPTSPCATDGDIGYDGFSPDHFCLNASGAGGSEPTAPDGRKILTITFDVAGNPGQFEFDTACFSSSFSKIFLLDGCWNPEFPPVIGFQKGIITISDCDCTRLGDCDGDDAITPVDVIYLVNTVYLGADPPPPLPWCPTVNGDWNCDDIIDPVDVMEIVGFVYRNSGFPPCDPCTGGRLPDLAITSTDILSNQDTIDVGDMIWLGVNIHNIGLATATAPTVAMFSGDPDNGGTLLDVVTAADIAPGDTLIKFVGQYMCETIGEFDIYGIVDWTEEIVESDEGNNKAYKTIVVK